MDLELVGFEIISNVGMAKSAYMEAIKLAKKQQYDEAKVQISEGDSYYAQAHGVHSELVKMEASGEGVALNILLVHAEDQMMSTEIIKILALELIDLYQKI